MTGTGMIILAFAAAVAVLSGIFALLYRRHMAVTMQRLKDMLDAAMEGTFTEQKYDETMLSELEAKMGRYLASAEVSRRKLAAEEDKIKELIADISHQTKTPIANILLYAELLEEQKLPEEAQDCVQALSGQAEKLRFLIASLVKLSRLENGILSLHPCRAAVEPVLLYVKEQFEKRAAEKNITLWVEHTESIAVFDEKWTAEAVSNVVDNAVKYTPCGGKVTIRVVEYEIFCCIEIADTGIGIAEEEQAKVFSRFYRSAAVNQKEGVGIGLYLAREILAEEGGYMKLSSRPGEGSVFSMYLPRGYEG